MPFDVVINGRVLGLPLNGIPRYAMEICKGLDRTSELSFKAAIVVPSGTSIKHNFNQIKVIELPNKKAWDFTVAESFAKKNNALYINLASKGVLYKNSISMIYDLRPLVYGDGKISFKTIKTKAKFFVSCKLSFLNSKIVVTLTDFTRNEIKRYARLNDIRVIGCGWEHMQHTQEDESVFNEYPDIKRGQYYFSVSSIAPHKNFSWIVENAKNNPDSQYVIVGKTDPRLWSDETSNFGNNIIYLGFQSDERVKALIKTSKGLLFPSLYEGFGIPPLEALACRTPAIVSNIPVMREIFGESVYYINPFEPNVDLTKCDAIYEGDVARKVLERYSWKNATKKWLNLIEGVLKS